MRQARVKSKVAVWRWVERLTRLNRGVQEQQEGRRAGVGWVWEPRRRQHQRTPGEDCFSPR